MKRAKWSDKEEVIQIITESYKNLPHIEFILKGGKNKHKQLAAFAEFVFEIGIRRNGVYLTNDNSGVIIFFDNHLIKKSLYENYLMVKMALKAMHWTKLYKILRLEEKISKHRDYSEPAIFAWLFGVRDSERGSRDAWKLMRFIFEESKQRKIPIIAETSIPQNHKIYIRFGFSDYYSFHTPFGFKMYFMKRSYDGSRKYLSSQKEVSTPKLIE